LSANTATSATEKATLREEQIDRLLADRYGLSDISQQALGGEFDQNVKISTKDDRHFLLKVATGSIDKNNLLWQNKLLAHLVDQAPNVLAPRIIAANDGDELVAWSVDSKAFIARLFWWLEGENIGKVAYHSPELLKELGHTAGFVVAALATMPAPNEPISHDWDMMRARSVIDEGLDSLSDEEHRADVEEIMSWYDDVSGVLSSLPTQVIHQDLNDANVLVQIAEDGSPRISGVIDVNDALHTIRVAEIAVCAGYAMLRKQDPLGAATDVIAAYDSIVPLTDEELSVVFPLAATRLCMNATTWTRRISQSASPYGSDRMRDTWPAIHRVAQIVPQVAEVLLREACGREATGNSAPLIGPGGSALPVTEAAPVVDIDFSVDGDFFDDLTWADPIAVRARLAQLLGDTHRRVGVIAHLQPYVFNEARRGVGTDEPQTIQLGLGLLMPLGQSIKLGFDALVEHSPTSDRPLVLRHGNEGEHFWTSWWGVEVTPDVGTVIASGRPIGSVSIREDVAGLDGLVQVVGTKVARLAPRVPRHARPSERDAWAALTFDPRSLLGINAAPDFGHWRGEEVLAFRSEHFGRSQRTYYRRPMNLVRGRGVWLYDENALAYLDSLNNVTHVGHAEPRVTAAAARQMKKLNTNSRFLYEGIASYAERLIGTLPAPLEVVFLVCSGSEANDLAIRIARQVTGRHDVVVIDGAYHGNTGVVTGLSPNRYKGPGGSGAPRTTHEVPTPDRYRGAYGYADADAGSKYAADAKRVFDAITDAGQAPAAFIAESLMGTAGNIVLPPRYLAESFAAARSVGALCISDEVQVGVGRMGDAFWGFQLGDVVPDIVTMGKPLGNGHPLAAVVTTRAIADAFDTGMKYFNTFGGNPVSCVIGETVLDIVEGDGLQAQAAEMGAYFKTELESLKAQHPLIGDVRGHGLYLGVDLVTDRERKTPAARHAMLVTELMKDRGVIVFPNGIHDNVLKIKPPMVFDKSHVDIYVETLNEVLSRPEMASR
jgi:4-aminobutyrate aminotransferase-like enzyme/Ser/Thr protein kinase RdoA (MazF antagonist)